MIKEHCYVAILRSGKQFDAMPFMTGVISLSGPDNLTFHQLMKAGSLNGRFVWTRTMVGNNGKEPYPKTLQEAYTFYQETIDAIVYNYENKHGPLNKSHNLAILDLQPILSAPQFIEHAVTLGLMTADTVARCRNTSVSFAALPPHASSAGCSSAPPSGASPLLSGGNIVRPEADSPSLPSQAESTSVSSAARPAESTPEEVNTAPPPQKTAPSTGDPVFLAMKENGLDFGAPAANVEVEVGDGEGEGFQLARLMEEENDRQADEELDFDRLAEDAILQVQALPVEEQQHPVVKSLGDTVKRQQVKIKELQGIVHSLHQLTATQDQTLREFQSSSAEDIIPGILPAIKKALGSIKQEITKGFDEKVDSLLVAVKEQGSAALATEVSSLRSCLATTAGKVSETNLLVQNTMGAVIMLDKNLTSVGLGSREANAPQVDIPAVLGGIQDKLQVSSMPPPSHFGSSATVESIEALKPSCTTAGPLFNSGTPSPGEASRKSSSSVTPTGVPPRKAGRWDIKPPGSTTPSLASGTRASSSFTPRSLEAQLTASGDTPSSNPQLYSAMVEAKNICFTPMTKEQIDMKTKEMRKQLAAKARR